MLNVISFIRNYSHLIIIGLICVCLWGLNARNSQLAATNDRLEQLSNSKDEQINQLRAKNDNLADGVKELTAAVRENYQIMSQVTEQRAITSEQNRKLQTEIKAYLAADKCAVSPVDGRAADRLRKAAEAAGGVSAGNDAGAASASGTDGPDARTAPRR